MKFLLSIILVLIVGCDFTAQSIAENTVEKVYQTSLDGLTEAVLLDGKPAIKILTNGYGSVTVESDYLNGEKALVFDVTRLNSFGLGVKPAEQGKLYITKTVINYSPYSDQKNSFNVPNSEIQELEIKKMGQGFEVINFNLQNEQKRFIFNGTVFYTGKLGGGIHFKKEELRPSLEFLLRTLTDFDKGLAEFDKLTVNVLQNNKVDDNFTAYTPRPKLSPIVNPIVNPTPRVKPTSTPRAKPTSTTLKSNKTNESQEVQQTEAVVNQITDKVGILFKEGMLALKDQKRSDAGEKFNKSVEVFLLSTMNVQSNQKLSGCYNGLIETIYRMEFPATRPPNIRSLSETCEWNWNNNDFLLADEIAKLVQKMPVQTDVQTNTALITSADRKTNQDDKVQIGFNEQVFENSPLDELAKLQLIKKEVVNRVVTAKEGDTVAKIAERYNESPIEIAKLNGLFTTSKLPIGREIKIPADNKSGKIVSSVIFSSIPNPTELKEILGAKPIQKKDGTIPIIVNFFDENLDDPYSMKIVRWSKLELKYKGENPYWSVYVKYRAKNIFGAYVLTEQLFYIRLNKVVGIETNF